MAAHPDCFPSGAPPLTFTALPSPSLYGTAIISIWLVATVWFDASRYFIW